MQALDKRKLELAAERKLELAAKLISGGNPEWLMRGLRRVRDMKVSPLIRMKPVLPVKAQVASDLKDMMQACDTLTKKLGRYSDAGIFAAGGWLAPAYSNDTDLATRLKEWKSRADKRLPELQQPGRGDLLDPHMNRAPRLVCAAAVILAWEEVHQRTVSATNPRAQKAAHELWQSAGGKSAEYGHAKSGHTGWRRYFQELILKGGPSAQFERMRNDIFYNLLMDKFTQDSIERGRSVAEP